MKHAKFGLIALASILGVGSAFSNTPKHFAGTTYYAITDGSGGYTWTKVQPQAPLSCQGSTAYCTIVTKGTFHPTANQLPTSDQATLVRVGMYK